MINIKINHRSYQAKENQTILEIAKANGIKIPTLCHLPRGKGKDSPRAVCRICVVEITGDRNLQAACSIKATDGMEVYTHSDKVTSVRRVLMEFILAEHGGDEIVADTEVKKLSASLGVHHPRFSLPKNPSPQIIASEYFNIEPDKCVHCDRCIVACETRQMISRNGFGQDVSVGFGAGGTAIDESDCNHCGDCVSACPAGGISLG